MNERQIERLIGWLVWDKRHFETVFWSLESSFREREKISIFHGCMVWIEKSVTRVTDRHHEACRVLPNSDPE